MEEDRPQDGVAGLVRERSEESQEIAGGDGPSLAKLKAGQRAPSDRRTAATAASGAELMRLSGARTLRWVPPRSAVTMDYRADRLTVSYDDNYTIVRISCG